jgi:hypothetical protein
MLDHGVAIYYPCPSYVRKDSHGLGQYFIAIKFMLLVSELHHLGIDHMLSLNQSKSLS